jgi:hypothetical protein
VPGIQGAKSKPNQLGQRGGANGGASNTVHNARITLLATLVNNIALAVVVAGFIAPAINGQLQGGSRALVTLAWIGFGAALHLCAQMALGSLRQ